VAESASLEPDHDRVAHEKRAAGGCLELRLDEETQMRSAKTSCLSALAAVLLAACGGGSGSSSTPANTTVMAGALVYNPPLRVGSVTAADFTANLQANAQTSASAKQLLQLLTSSALLPVCGVDFHYIQYYTVGGAGEPTTASGALMVPTGLPGVCTGMRPIVVYAHGTASTRTYNIANPNDTTNEAANESGLIAAVFAAQGYIVVAPNYAGYDSSPLPYHPFLNADQQSNDMIYALTAARSALGHIPAASTLDGGKLFITGYSQGGHVAMATHKAMEAKAMKVTASAPLSGPYALAAFGDAIFFGDVNLGSTEFFPLIVSSYQHAYKNLYRTTSDIIESTYATGFDTLLPGESFATLVQKGKLPLTHLFNSTPPTGTCNDPLFPSITPPTTPPAQAPLFALGFGSGNLVKNIVRAAVVCDALVNPDGAVPTPTTGVPAVNPQTGIRIDSKINDLRNWAPMTAPILLCGGGNDPTVFFLNTQIMQGFWHSLPAGVITALDVDLSTANSTDSPLPFVPLQAAFSTTYASLQASLGQNAIAQYHTLVAPFCTVAAAGYFRNF
jgi:acetyl esterase/lipase